MNRDSHNRFSMIVRTGDDPSQIGTDEKNLGCTFPGTPSGDKADKAEWFDFVCWNKLGQICMKYLTKGRKVFVEGHLKANTWEEKKGNKHKRIELVAEKIEFLDNKSK